jgi:UDP-2-acetamido-2,6-beta-L-arabino-hexul-4-ose reductase
MKNLLITGSEGFIGKNLVTMLGTFKDISVNTFNHVTDISLLSEYLKEADYVIHLAGENRTKDLKNLTANNVDFTSLICKKIKAETQNSGRFIKIIFASSVQADLDNPYGRSKLEAEKIIKTLSNEKNCMVNIFRLPGVFGKWCKPEYNSVVATFCYNIAREIPIRIDDVKTELKLVYIDDVLKNFMLSLNQNDKEIYKTIKPEYSVSLGELATQIKSFKSSRENLRIDSMGSGFLKLLYSTYLSYLPSSQFSYQLHKNVDVRGKFVEVLKSSIFGQVSYLTINVKQERGGHFHHTKTEKFLVLKGSALFRFKNLITNEFIEIKILASDTRMVESIPGWAHDIVNNGNEEVIIMVWSNEIYDPQNPDTIEHGVLS